MQCKERRNEYAALVWMSMGGRRVEERWPPQLWSTRHMHSYRATVIAASLTAVTAGPGFSGGGGRKQGSVH